jgi:hypothetical protein
MREHGFDPVDLEPINLGEMEIPDIKGLTIDRAAKMLGLNLPDHNTAGKLLSYRVEICEAGRWSTSLWLGNSEEGAAYMRDPIGWLAAHGHADPYASMEDE